MPALEILRVWLGSAWRLFTDTPVPGLSSDLVFVSFADLIVAFFLIRISLGILGAGIGFAGSSYHSSSSKNAKISKERKGDEY